MTKRGEYVCHARGCGRKFRSRSGMMRHKFAAHPGYRRRHKAALLPKASNPRAKRPGYKKKRIKVGAPKTGAPYSYWRWVPETPQAKVAERRRKSARGSCELWGAEKACRYLRQRGEEAPPPPAPKPTPKPKPAPKPKKRPTEKQVKFAMSLSRQKGVGINEGALKKMSRSEVSKTIDWLKGRPSVRQERPERPRGPTQRSAPTEKQVRYAMDLLDQMGPWGWHDSTMGQGFHMPNEAQVRKMSKKEVTEFIDDLKREKRGWW